MNTPRQLLPLILALAVFPVGAFAADPTGRIAIGAQNTPGDADSLYRITAPGSYYLTGNIVAVAGKSGIEIASSHVTLDLNGFTLKGSALALDGIRVEALIEPEDISIRNGSVDGWGRFGIRLFANVAGQKGETSVIEHVQASRNLSGGICAAWYATIRHCTASHNGGTGITTLAGASIDSSIAMGNAGYGIVMGGGTARGCVASENLWNGISASSGSAVVDCTANDNGSSGFSGRDAVTFERCAANTNGDFGFWVSESKVVGCVAERNQQGGIRTGESSAVVDNAIVGLRSAGNNSPAPGIMVDGAGNTIVNNTISRSSTGIRVPLMQHATGSNHIEANKLTGNDVGMKVESTVNIIARNTARNAQKNYQIVAGNRVGTIVVPPLTSAAINGNSGGASGTTDPWSNIAY